ncbi:sacsin N-terminal ATP-binding-like domain-containing protein, partial [Streptomyces pathocidini]
MVQATPGGADPFGTARLRRGVLDAWAASPARFREDANAEEDLALGGYRDRLVVELAQNAADAAARAGVPGRLRLTFAPTGPTGSPHTGPTGPIGSAPTGSAANGPTGSALAAGGGPATLIASNTGAPLDAPGVESLSTLRASAKRDDDPVAAVGRFGVGFAAVLAVSDEPAVVGRAGGVRWSLAEARELAREAAGAARAAEAGGAAARAAGAADTAGAGPGEGLADELRRRDGHVPLLRLPLPAEGTAPVGYDTAVVLPLRDGAAADLVARLLAGIDDALLLTLPGLDEVVVETPESVRTLTRHQEGLYVVIEDREEHTVSGAAPRPDTAPRPHTAPRPDTAPQSDTTLRSDTAPGSDAARWPASAPLSASAPGAASAPVTRTTRWRTSAAGGALDAALLADRPVEERLRPVWSVTWAVPVRGDEPLPGHGSEFRPVRGGEVPPVRDSEGERDGGDRRGAPARPATAPVVHAPTPTDEPLDLPALLIASFPLEPTRRHAAPGPLTDFLVERAAEAYVALVRDWRPVGTGTIDLVPGPLGKGELDGRLRA